MSQTRGRYLFIILSIFVVLLCGIGSGTQNPALAEGEFAVSFVTKIDLDGNAVEYDTSELEVAKCISIGYTIPYDYYSIRVETAAGLLKTATSALPVVEGKAVYEVGFDGYLRVICTARLPNGDVVEGVEELVTYIKSDNSIPNEPDVTEMTSWVNSPFMIDVIMPSDSGLAGIASGRVDVRYFSGTVEHYNIEEEVANFSFSISDNCEVSVYVYDKCGNVFVKSYRYDKFDVTPPARPSFVFTGNVDKEAANGYVKEYAVEILVGEDKNSLGVSESGADEKSVKYILNGQLHNYEGKFFINEQRINTLSAYYSDKAGNVSARTEAEIKNIDATEPALSEYLNFILLSVDLMKEEPYTLSVVTADLDSGIGQISVKGLDLSFEGTNSTFKAVFSELDLAQFSITVYDKVGNFSTVSVPTKQFGNPKRVETAKKYNELFLTLKKEDYSTEGWDKVINAYSNLNILFMSQTATELEFNNAIKAVMQTTTGAVERKFRIESAPEGISGRVSFEMNEGDIPSIKKGDSVSLVLSSVGDIGGEIENKLKLESGYITCFIRPFKLKLYHNSSEYVGNLENGIVVYMSYPVGLEGRQFKVAALSSGEIIESREENGSICFEIPAGGDYAVIFQGNAGEGEEEEIKGVKIAGKMVSYGWFFGSLSGIIVLAAGAVVLVTLLHKKGTI